MMRLFSYFSKILLILLCMLALPAKAQDNPLVLLESLTNDMIQALKENDAAIRKDSNAVIPLIEKILSPHVDYAGMARWIVGRQNWLSASEVQKQDFTEQFKLLLIRTYSKVLVEYNNQEIVYLPIRGEYADKGRVQIESEIRESGKEPTRVVYRLIQINGIWKVYDIIIEGVSLLKGFQSQFTEEIKQKGFDLVIADLKKHNAQDIGR